MATAIAAGLGGYLAVSHNALRLAQRTYYLNDAANLAEAGLEEAAYCFRLINAGVAVSSAWNGWTVNGNNARLTLPSFSRGLSAVGTVKVYVEGFNGSTIAPYAISQATITPLDGSPPVIKTLKIGLRKKGAYSQAIVTTTALDLGTGSVIDSFNSNPTDSTEFTPLDYPGTGAAAGGDVVVLGGTASLGNRSLIQGDLLLDDSVAAPDASHVTGTIVTDYSGSFPLPTFPAIGSITRGYLLLAFPGTLPRPADRPASDGRYYYFGLLSPIGATTIAAGANVTVVASRVTSGLTIQAGASCIIYTFGTVSTSGNSGIVNQSWAGALQIFTSTGGTCDIGSNNEIRACIYAPFADVRLTGGGSSPSFVGSIMARAVRTSANLAFHYDEALQHSSLVVGIGWSLTNWYDLHGTPEAAGLGAATSGFLD
ncbi:MAG: hypothetical protein HZC55_16815 [Verrucomicrobia bacterium]|nr:hypothetical protein [Verrucomicrobiota bacterium]